MEETPSKDVTEEWCKDAPLTETMDAMTYAGVVVQGGIVNETRG